MNWRTILMTACVGACVAISTSELYAQTAITQVTVRVKTSYTHGSCDWVTCGGPPSSTDSTVYVGLGGREFTLDSAINDFESGSDTTYVLGSSANVPNASTNDPSSSVSLTGAFAFPVYIRMSELRDDDWGVEYVEIRVFSGTGSSMSLKGVWVAQPLALKLGRRFGYRLFLSRAM
jgi:hypothetical protein